MTGTFDNWAATEKLDKVGDAFEKTVALPDSSQKILYKVRTRMPYVSSRLSRLSGCPLLSCVVLSVGKTASAAGRGESNGRQRPRNAAACLVVTSLVFRACDPERTVHWRPMWTSRASSTPSAFPLCLVLLAFRGNEPRHGPDRL